MALRALKVFRARELSALAAETQGNVGGGHVPQLPNPFIPHKNPTTGRWAPPKYSLRRQADLIKSAKSLGLIHLLPPGSKGSLDERMLSKRTSGTQQPTRSKWWQQQVIWQGELKDEKKSAKENQGGAVKKRVPSMTVKQIDGLGAIKLYSGRKRMFKGHKWERERSQREKKRRILMRDMKERIVRYKEWYHRRRPNPLKPSRSAKAPKLPF